jgi:methyl-accepting chemotaxis protein
MAKKKTAKAASAQAAKAAPTADAVDGLGSGLYHLAKATQSIADEIDSLKYKTEEMAESLNHISNSIDGFGTTVELAIIAQYGSEEDRTRVVEHLKKGSYSVFESD